MPDGVGVGVGTEEVDGVLRKNHHTLTPSTTRRIPVSMVNITILRLLSLGSGGVGAEGVGASLVLTSAG